MSKFSGLVKVCLIFLFYAKYSLEDGSFPLLSPVTSLCTPTCPSSPTPTAHPSSPSTSLSTSRHYLAPPLPSKSFPATPNHPLYFKQKIIEEMQTPFLIVNHVA